MKINNFKIFPFLLTLLLSCNSESTKQESSSMNHQNEKVDDEQTQEWDKHQFFDDLKWTTLDSLGKVIDLSDSVIAYNWNDGDENSANVYHYIVDAYGAFDDRIGLEVILDMHQVQSLKKILTDSENFDGSNTTCFIPHIAFVYYKESEIIGQSNICFLCSGVKSIPKSTSALSDEGINDLKQFCKNIGLEIID